MIQTSTATASGSNLAMVAVRSTALSVVRQPVTTARLGHVVFWHRLTEIIRANTPFGPDESYVSAAAPGTAGFEGRLDRGKFSGAQNGKLVWLVDGSSFFPELDRQIAAARDSIHFQMFIFDNDDIGVRYADALKLRSLEIPVRVLFDDLGNTLAHQAAPEALGPHGFVPPSDMKAYLRRNAKTDVRRTLNPWLVCDHTKLLVFDGQVALIGGMNIGREYYSEWHDLMVRVEGPIVNLLLREFNRAWEKAGPWGDFSLLHKPGDRWGRSRGNQEIPLRILRTDPAEGRYEILEASLLAIRSARRRIWIQNPYFAHDDLVEAVASAARRGVEVRVIIPKGDEPSFMDMGNLASARILLLAGAKMYGYPKMTHLKVMICDDWASVGSANFDTLSMRINRELNLAFADRETVSTLEKTVFLPDFRQSAQIHLRDTNGWPLRLAESVADQL